MDKALTPVIVGAAQFTQQKDTPRPLDPLGLMIETSRRAIEDAGPKKITDFIDSVYVPNIISWSYRDVPGMLAESLGIRPSKKTYYPVSGNLPQMFVNQSAKAIASGESEAVLLAGAEAAYAGRRARKGEIALDWPERQTPQKVDGDDRLSTSDFENNYHLLYPLPVYTMLESALKAKSGRTTGEHIKFIGQILEHFSAAVTKTPYAWMRDAYSAEEITTPTPKNRYTCYPYTIRMVANPQVDQAAALIMTSAAVAEKLGIDRSCWIYPMGGSDIRNIRYLSQRPEFHDSPAIKEGARLALAQAGLNLDQIDMFDIYSCFPAMIQILLQEMGIPADDPRGLTLTGGLPYFGAPLSNYSMHAIAAAVERIREAPASKAMITAIGGINFKASFGIYGTEPPATPWGQRNDSNIQDAILAKSLPKPTEKANGTLTVEAYAIHYNREGGPKLGTVLGRLESGRRTLADIDSPPEELDNLVQNELVGFTGEVGFDNKAGRNMVRFKC